jgi:hypothetical protein
MSDPAPECTDPALSGPSLLVPYSISIKQEYRDFKDSEDVGSAGPNLKKLLNAINTVRVSTAECERGFSQMNLTCIPLRSQLTVEHMSTLLFISVTGPPLEIETHYPM